MANLKGNFEGFSNRTGLYRVWVPLHDDGQAPLISIWIDSTMTAFERQAHEEPATISGVHEEEIGEEIEDSIRRVPVFLSGLPIAALCVP